ncbi:ATP-grasp domain-containing protein [Dietzia lutea]|uniref:Biotin carboxylase n=1 Tax=Dietzia lutea TaxID=546160 RepID=A0A2S1R3Z6_9ACTN|nr:ATP-grasp domain-containing protein [Dietzia lutea]AWH90972.1 biotin carboxylase [Dietzia lutea]
MSQKNVFVVGLDDANRRTLQDIGGAVNYRFHGLLEAEDVLEGDFPMAELLDRARGQLESFDGSIDAIVGYWDFPVSSIVPILCREYGLPGAPLEAVLACEHKYWSRLEQQKVIPDAIPGFGLVSDEDPRLPEGLSYPVWLKPVKSFSSELAFKADDGESFAAAVREITAGISRVGEPFEYVMGQAELPREIEEIGGTAILVEEALTGQQAATEGYVYQGEVVLNGALDSLNYPGTSSFQRHQYPSQLPQSVVDRMREVSERVVRQVRLDNCTFSIEFFCDPDTGAVHLLEINARHSQSHAELFEYVDGLPNHHCMVSIGVGEDPTLPMRQGPYAIAAKWYHRAYEDGVVKRAPTADELEELYAREPGVVVDVQAHAGTRLSDMDAQDSYSYELAYVYVGADSEDELVEKYQRVVESLPFEISGRQEGVA